ncbi:ABC transporter substrate-binding protein [Microlunatus elymi]|uniref:ABC transporter substrate-binding protein n=2 Tax=Microlunatus elymi TaxID=2596828 RepID=A0A516Q599_9ACTN|nr:ABC transporter substrate-binding protein [Microlunatus elymi]
MNVERWTNSWATNRRRFLALAGAGATGVILGSTVTACGSAAGNKNPGAKTSGAAKGRAGDAGETLFVAGFQWGPPTSFNPYSATPAWPTGGGQSQLIYETLLRWNILDGKLYAGLGKSMSMPDKYTIEVPLQEGTKWADGQDLTADDVVYTFELGKQAALNFSNVWTYLDKVEAKDPRTVAFTLKKNPYNPPTVKGALNSVLILPKHIWSKTSPDKIITVTNMEPVGSGPFKIGKADQTQVHLLRDDNYWGNTAYGKPPMKIVHHQIYKSNSDGDLALESGQVDASQQFTSQIWTMWEDKGKPVGTWLKEKPYYIPGNLPSVIFNLSKKGLDNVKVRKAFAYAINYGDIAKTAMSSYSDDAQASMIVPKGSEEKYFDASAVQANGWEYNPDKAEQILTDELKAKKGSDGIYSLPDGTKLGGWTISCPTGWSDWNTSCEIISKNLKAVGIDVKTNFPQAPTWTTAMQNGNFDLVHNTYTGVGPNSPWARYRDMLDNRGVPKIGKQAFYNYGRFSDSRVPALLDKAAAAANDQESIAAIRELDNIFRETIPVIPVMYRPLEFYEYNESNWTNFPDEKNPYAPPMWQGAGIQWLFKLKRVGS